MSFPEEVDDMLFSSLLFGSGGISAVLFVVIVDVLVVEAMAKLHDAPDGSSMMFVDVPDVVVALDDDDASIPLMRNDAPNDGVIYGDFYGEFRL